MCNFAAVNELGNIAVLGGSSWATAPAKIQQQIIEIIKKYKLEVEKPSQDLIATWTSE